MDSEASQLFTLDVEVPSPLGAYAALQNLPQPFLLHSSLPGARSRWSFFGADPFVVFRGGDFGGVRAAWERIAARVGASDLDGDPDAPPFRGGLVGYWSYDFGRRLERLPSIARDDLGLPDFVLGGYDVVGAHDHVTGRTRLFSSGLPQGRARARERLAWFAERLRAARQPRFERNPSATGTEFHSTFTPDQYRRAVEQVRDHIRRGDIFQANLSQRWSFERAPVTGPGFTSLVQQMASLCEEFTPAPFAACLDLGDHAIVSASPERFLQLRGRRVEARPIKGTRPRGGTPAEDAALSDALLASAKDRAENVMIVDVLRNDLGRVCETGSVIVPELCALESFPQVHHLTSTITGLLRPGLGAFDLFTAAFPGGSITGAPKIRAMEVIDSIEPVRRHLYTGAIGYLDWSGDADWNIAIRTALLTPTFAHIAAGGGITADSDPDEEFLESLVKLSGMRSVVSSVLDLVPVAHGVAAR